MANISNAFGDCTVTAKDSETAQRVAELLHSLIDSFGYYTHLNLEDGVQSKEMNTFECSFYADGRWSFKNNMEMMGAWIRNNEEINKSTEIIKELEKEDFKVSFDYVDEEQGCAFIEDGVASIHHKANTPIESMEYIPESCECYDYTVKNLIEICGYDREYAEELFDDDSEENA